MGQIYWIIVSASCLIIGFFLGWIFRKNIRKKKAGVIIVEPSREDAEKDVFRIIFEIGLDDIKVRKEVFFGVDDQTKTS